MQAERQNSKLGDAMDSLDTLPEGFSFNSSRVWDQLESKLPGRRSKRKVSWYAAASVVLLCAAGLLLWSGQKNSTGYNKPASVTVKKNPEEQVIRPGKEKTAAPEIAAARRWQNTIHKPGNKKEAESSVHNAVPATPVLTTGIQELTQTVTSQQNINATMPLEEKKAPVLSVAKKPLPRPYRIIHLNDLDAMPVPAQNNLSRSALKKIMQHQNEDKEAERISDPSPYPLLFLKKQSSANTLSDNR